MAGQDLGAVRRHINYLDRGGALEIETDEGERLQGKGAAQVLLDDWDLDLDENRPTADLKPWGRGKAPKLVQKLLFSMPAGTPPKKVLAAVKNFAREEFGAKHRYAMVLHTDEPHPHVHMVVKAMGHDGKRLNIRRDTLRDWRTGIRAALAGAGRGGECDGPPGPWRESSRKRPMGSTGPRCAVLRLTGARGLRPWRGNSIAGTSNLSPERCA